LYNHILHSKTPLIAGYISCALTGEIMSIQAHASGIAGIRNGDIPTPWLREALRNVSMLVEGDNL